MTAISIVVPIFKVERYLNQCLDSILVQTFTDFELILVDDGSPDQCGEICDRYAEKDNRIKVIHKPNGGVSSARNAGINIAKGEYLAFVDPDDTIEPQMYETLIQMALKHEADMVVCQIKSINTVQKTFSISSVWKEVNCNVDRETIETELIPSILINKTYSLVSSVNKLYKRSIFNSLNIRFDSLKHHSEDAKLNFTLLTRINSLVFVDNPLYNYFVRETESLTRVFREDMHQYALDNKKFLIEICREYDLLNHINIVRNHFSEVILTHMQDVVIGDLPTDRKYKVLHLILNNREFSEDILKYQGSSIFYWLLKKVCVKKNAKLFFKLVMTKNKIQYYLHKVG